MEIKMQIPPITAMATPAVRMVVVTAETGPPAQGEEDYGGWTVLTNFCPVLALHYVGEQNDFEEVYGAVFLTGDGMFANTHKVHDRCQAKVCYCPWPPEEDAERLKTDAAELARILRHLVEQMLQKGQPPYHGFDERRIELAAAEARQHRRRRKGRPRRDESSGQA